MAQRHSLASLPLGQPSREEWLNSLPPGETAGNKIIFFSMLSCGGGALGIGTQFYYIELLMICGWASLGTLAPWLRRWRRVRDQILAMQPLCAPTAGHLSACIISNGTQQEGAEFRELA